MISSLPGVGEGIYRLLHLSQTVTADFHHQDGTGITEHKVAVTLLGEIRLGAFEDMPVDEFASTWVIMQCQ